VTSDDGDFIRYIEMCGIDGRLYFSIDFWWCSKLGGDGALGGVEY
jgi:hypothetical protein